MESGLLLDNFVTKNIMTILALTTIIAILVFVALIKIYGSKDWIKIEGVIHSIQLTEIYNDPVISTSKNKTFTEYKIDVEYEYTINGKKFAGSQIYPIVPNVFSDKKQVNNILEKYKAGISTTIFVNPSNPGESCLINTGSMSTKQIIIVVITFVFISLVLIGGVTLFSRIFQS